MVPHEYYDQLCTSAAAGQLSRDEWAELNDHPARTAKSLETKFKQVSNHFHCTLQPTLMTF